MKEEQAKLQHENDQLEKQKQQLVTEHKGLMEEKLTLNRIADEVRQSELKLSQAVKAWCEQGVPIPFVVKDSGLVEYSCSPSQCEQSKQCRKPRGTKASGRNAIKKKIMTAQA
eukprot:TRINITY_DN122948_c0_g1_i1.p2 TRINITY_DN122948_c0_g1~~TRINITY_DN122948_c0_g1_i1.p2  ORF type:complete len:113 (+),score=24.11 TRINITY_DN122948_c0_g1_i1:106-444(+)